MDCEACPTASCTRTSPYDMPVRAGAQRARHWDPYDRSQGYPAGEGGCGTYQAGSSEWEGAPPARERCARGAV